MTENFSGGMHREENGAGGDKKRASERGRRRYTNGEGGWGADH